MRLALALCFLLGAEPALACHHFAVWKYPIPQSCKASSVRSARAPHRTWFAEVKPEPAPQPTPASEDPARDAAINQLRAELRARAGAAIELQTIGLTKEEVK